jgi:hypothetical protein
MSTIFRLTSDGKLVHMTEHPYLREAELQKLLADHPDLLPGDAINPDDPRRWFFVCREAALPTRQGGAWLQRVDNLFLDQDAIPTLVEVKLSRNPEIYQSVVAQLLSYAANASVTWTAQDLHNLFVAAHPGIDPDRHLFDFLGADTTPDQFWQLAASNLRAGKMRLIFVVDTLPEELRRIIEFLNLQMDPAEVLALEIRQFAQEGDRTLVPTLIGQTAQARLKKARSSGLDRLRDEPTFVNALKQRADPVSQAVALRLVDWAKARSLPLYWGHFRNIPSFAPEVLVAGGAHYLAILISSGHVDIPFDQLMGTRPFTDAAMRVTLLNRLNSIPGVNLPEDSITKRVSFLVAALDDPSAFEQFTAIFDWFSQEVAAAHSPALDP